MAGGGPWARLAAALAPPAPPALRRPRPSARHQTELLLLLLDSPPLPERCPAGADPGAAAPGSDGSDPGAALLALLSEPAPGPPRCLLLVAALSVLAARGDRAGLAALAALLQRPGTAGTAPAAAAECERELRRIAAATGTPGIPGTTGTGTGTTGTPGRGCPAPQPLLLLRAEGAADPAGPWGEAGLDPGSAFGLAPPARAQLLHLPRSGAGGGVPGAPPVLACADPAPVQAALLGGGLGAGGARRLAALALHPALPPPLRLFFLLCLLQGGGRRGGDPQNPPRPPPLTELPPHLAAALFPGGGGGTGDPPELFLPRFEAAAALCDPPQITPGGAERLPTPPQILEGAARLPTPPQIIPGEGAVRPPPTPPQIILPGGREWLWAQVEFLGGGPPDLFCRAVLSYCRRFGGVPGGALGVAAQRLLGGGHPAAPPHLLELAKVLGGSLGGALMAQVLRAPPPPPGSPQLRAVLRVLRDPPATPPQILPQLRGYLRRALAAGGRGWGGAQGVLSAAAPLLPRGGVPLCPPPPRDPPSIWGGGDPDLWDRCRLQGALAAALGPPKLAAVLGPPPRCAPAPPPQNGSGGGSGGGGGAPPSLLPAPPPLRMRCLPGPLPPFGAPPGAPQEDPEGWGGALLAGGGRPVPLPLRLRLEPLGGPQSEGTPTRNGGSGTPPQIGDPETPPQIAAPPPPVLALQVLLGGGGAWAEGALAALGGGRGGGGGGAELTLTLRPPRALPPSLEAAAIFSPGRGAGDPQEGGGVSFLAPLPPLELPLGVRLRPLGFPPPWDPPRARSAFEALWGALGGGPETLLVLGGGAAAPPPALAPLLVPSEGGGAEGGGGWALAAAAPPKGVVLARGGPGGEGRVRGQRWGGVLLLARLLRGEGGA
ncbi:basic proline-rich protein-like [Zonotrichia leucophrys gambelii]|uniref:basic proline-rich protein-like n=1 Tax=Zonotrichia leucophrys gambelii TaxID=257770 RepID=UPI0031405AB3